tara:strand:- start:3005 stop:3481 length:477 start_codon:yes stop_codon:yes gene_type:complete
MKTKKGFLLGEHTLKIIIAVLCLLLLAYLLFSMYSSYKDNRNLEIAEASLDELIETMKLAKSSPQESTILNPKNWILLNYIKTEERPISCNKGCICLCEKASSAFPGDYVVAPASRKEQTKKCNKIGVCKSVSEDVKKFSTKLPVDLQINYDGIYEIK